MNDIPIQRNIRIGNATVGLIGLDVAMGKVLRERHLDTEAAIDFLFDAVKRQNYVPPAAEEAYRQAIRHEYERLLGQAVGHEGRLKIRILGPGCVSCNRLGSLLYEILQQMDVAADVEQVHDLDEIWRHGVTKTPALIINDQVKSAGRIPTRAEVEQWLREVLDS